MIKTQKQIVGHDPKRGFYGDCFRTAVAVVLGRNLHDVPHTAENGADGMHDRMRKWLRHQGLDIVTVGFDESCTMENVLACSQQMNPGIPLLVSGRSPRGPFNHVVVVLDGKVVCDPSTGEAASNRCLTGPCENPEGNFWYLEAIVRLPVGEVDWERNARALFDLLDDIDTAEDVAKGDLAFYQRMVRKAHKKRFDYASTDGYDVEFKSSDPREIRREAARILRIVWEEYGLEAMNERLRGMEKDLN